VNRQINQEAAEWFVEVNADAPDFETRKRFDKWLRASPQHVRAFLDMVPIWEDGGQLPLSADATPEQLIERARAAVNVVGMQGAVPPPMTRYPGSSARVARIAAVLAAVAVTAVLVLGYQQLRYPTYATGLGEQRSLTLPDGSMLELNTLSRVRVRYSGRERVVELLNGQALFDVAKDPGRPFVVYSGETRVRAVGTQFDVYRQPVDTLVTVVEGRVAVYDAALKSANDAAAGALAVPGSTLVAAGEQLRVSAHAVGRVEHPNMALATAWTQRQLVFDDTPLTDVTQEFDRYNKRRLIIDGALRDFRVSGIFSSTDPASLIRFLREQPGISVEEADDQVHISGSGMSR
jgi:transmembrane sensor